MPGRDYSGTPLSAKLGAKPGVEVVVLFTTSRAELEARFAALKATLAPRDGLRVAWPKRASRIETDLSFETVQEIGLAHGLVDNKSGILELDETQRFDQFRALTLRRYPSSARVAFPVVRWVEQSDRKTRLGLDERQ
jgi:hypothetical protein